MHPAAPARGRSSAGGTRAQADLAHPRQDRCSARRGISKQGRSLPSISSALPSCSRWSLAVDGLHRPFPESDRSDSCRARRHVGSGLWAQPSGIWQSVSEPPFSAGVADRVATITLNRPDKLNAFNEAMHDELAAASTRRAPTRASARVLLTGAGRGFCAGQDLGDRVDRRRRGAARPRRHDRALTTPWSARSARLERPGGRARSTASPPAPAPTSRSPATSSSPRARPASSRPSAKIGLVPDCGGTWLLPRLVGPAARLGLALLGDKLAAEDAERLGPDLARVDDDALLAEASALARAPGAPADPRPRPDQARAASTSADQRPRRRSSTSSATCSAQPGGSRDYAEGVARVHRQAPAGLQRPLMTAERPRRRRRSPRPCATRCAPTTAPRGARHHGRGDRPGHGDADDDGAPRTCSTATASATAASSSRSPTRPSPSPATPATGRRWRQALQITFIAPARLGDVLTAERARESRRAAAPASTTWRSPRRTARVALFRGRSYETRGAVVDRRQTVAGGG